MRLLMARRQLFTAFGALTPRRDTQKTEALNERAPRGALSINRSSSCSTCATMATMSRKITQRELRNESGEIMRGLDRGESYVVTRNGVPVGELLPVRRRVFVPALALLSALEGAPPIDSARFRRDVDAVIDQDPRPRA